MVTPLFAKGVSLSILSVGSCLVGFWLQHQYSLRQEVTHFVDCILSRLLAVVTCRVFPFPRQKRIAERVNAEVRRVRQKQAEAPAQS